MWSSKLLQKDKFLITVFTN